MAYQVGKGTVLQVSINSTFTTIGNQVEIQSPSISNPAIDVTCLTDSWRNKIPSIPDGGSLDISGIHEPILDTHKRLHNSASSNVTDSWKIVSSPTTTNTITFQGWVSAYQVTGITVDNAQRFSATITVTSAVTIST